MSAIKTLVEMDRIREKQASALSKAAADHVSEPIEYQDKVAFIVSRCIKGPQGWKGLFRVDQLLTEDNNGKRLKVPIRKPVADGVDIANATSAMETAVRRRVFK